MFEPQVIEAIFVDGKLRFPKEACGVVIETTEGQEYVPCKNEAEGDLALDRFELSPSDYMAAEERGEVIAIAHTHPNSSANPTDADLVMCSRTNVPWIIMSIPSGVHRVIEPSQQGIPLVGRTFHHGVLDCYSLIRDYYEQRVGIVLPEFERDDRWWSKGANLYVENFEFAGFVKVASDGSGVPAPHDVVLMQIRSDRLNHGAVMDAEKPGHILHHLYGQLSRHDVWGGVWARHTGLVLRHKELMND